MPGHGANDLVRSSVKICTKLSFNEDKFCTISAGAHVRKNNTGETHESISLRVDRALYNTNESGRSQMITYQ